MAKRMQFPTNQFPTNQFPTNQFTTRYFRITCKVSRAIKLVKALYDIAPRYVFVTEERGVEKNTVLLTFSIPYGICDSEIALLDNVIDYLLKE